MKKLPQTLAQLKIKSNLCTVYQLKQARRLAIFAAGIFYVHSISYSSVPCGALMRPQPVSGGRQRGAELFCFSPNFNLFYCFI